MRRCAPLIFQKARYEVRVADRPLIAGVPIDERLTARNLCLVPASFLELQSFAGRRRAPPLGACLRRTSQPAQWRVQWRRDSPTHRRIAPTRSSNARARTIIGSTSLSRFLTRTAAASKSFCKPCLLYTSPSPRDRQQ